jgi:hypothetical protein
MLNSVTALNPNRRLRTSVLSLKNVFLNNGVRNVAQVQLSSVTGPRRLSTSFSTQSNQLEYDLKTKNRSPNNFKIDITSAGTPPIRAEEKLPELDENPVPKAFTITVVDTVARAREVLEIMYRQQRSNPETIWACDTESADIDLSVQGAFTFLIIENKQIILCVASSLLFLMIFCKLTIYMAIFVYRMMSVMQLYAML